MEWMKLAPSSTASFRAWRIHNILRNSLIADAREGSYIVITLSREIDLWINYYRTGCGWGMKLERASFLYQCALYFMITSFHWNWSFCYPCSMHSMCMFVSFHWNNISSRYLYWDEINDLMYQALKFPLRSYILIWTNEIVSVAAFLPISFSPDHPCYNLVRR